MRRFLLFVPFLLALVSVTCAPPVEDPLKKGPEGAKKDDETPVTPVADMPRGLQPRVLAAIEHVRSRDLLTTHSFWTVFHGILGMGLDTQLTDPDNNTKIGAVEHIRTTGKVRGLEFIPTADGLDVRTGPVHEGQGHQDQFVAEMGQWGMPKDTRFLVGNREFTFLDFARHSKMRARTTSNQELSWAVCIVGQYFGTDIEWVNNQGEKLTFDDMIRYEMGQPIEENAACGGTHRLFGLTWSFHLHMQRGGKKTEVWQDVEKFTDRYAKQAKQYQNPDGSFSTKYLAGPDNKRDVQLRIGTTGHVLEWLALALPDEELKAGWMEEAANALAKMILESRTSPVESGALYHATHGLQIYYTRLWGPPPGHPAPMVPPHPLSKKK